MLCNNLVYFATYAYAQVKKRTNSNITLKLKKKYQNYLWSMLICHVLVQ